MKPWKLDSAPVNTTAIESPFVGHSPFARLSPSEILLLNQRVQAGLVRSLHATFPLLLEEPEVARRSRGILESLVQLSFRSLSADFDPNDSVSFEVRCSNISQWYDYAGDFLRDLTKDSALRSFNGLKHIGSESRSVGESALLDESAIIAASYSAGRLTQEVVENWLPTFLDTKNWRYAESRHKAILTMVGTCQPTPHLQEHLSSTFRAATQSQSENLGMAARGWKTFSVEDRLNFLRYWVEEMRLALDTRGCERLGPLLVFSDQSDKPSSFRFDAFKNSSIPGALYLDAASLKKMTFDQAVGVVAEGLAEAYLHHFAVLFPDFSSSDAFWVHVSEPLREYASRKADAMFLEGRARREFIQEVTQPVASLEMYSKPVADSVKTQLLEDGVVESLASASGGFGIFTRILSTFGLD